MKLTRECAARLGRHESRGFPVSDFEFRPEDFEDHIVLTVEEAKRIEEIFDCVVRMHNKDEVKLTSYGFETIYMLKNKVKQAEKCDVEDPR